MFFFVYTQARAPRKTSDQWLAVVIEIVVRVPEREPAATKLARRPEGPPEKRTARIRTDRERRVEVRDTEAFHFRLETAAPAQHADRRAQTGSGRGAG